MNVVSKERFITTHCYCLVKLISSEWDDDCGLTLYVCEKWSWKVRNIRLNFCIPFKKS